MAMYHIIADLQQAVNKDGCGSVDDWNQIAKPLISCIDAGVSQDIAPLDLNLSVEEKAKFVYMGQMSADAVIIALRSKVRLQCIDDRRSRGLHIAQ